MYNTESLIVNINQVGTSRPTFNLIYSNFRGSLLGFSFSNNLDFIYEDVGKYHLDLYAKAFGFNLLGNLVSYITVDADDINTLKKIEVIKLSDILIEITTKQTDGSGNFIFANGLLTNFKLIIEIVPIRGINNTINYIGSSTVAEGAERFLPYNFINGYQSNGDTFSGKAVKMSKNNTLEALFYALDFGYQIISQPTQLNDPNLITILNYFYSVYDIQSVFCAGANNFTFINNKPELSTIICGAGLDGTNDTGYTCDFIDRHPPYDTWDIVSMTQFNANTIDVRVNLIPGVTEGLINQGQVVKFSNVNGFDYNPDGRMTPIPYQDLINYNGIRINGVLGTGSLQPGAKLEMIYQSDSHAYITGIIANIKKAVEKKENRECTWWEARFRAKVTASKHNVKDLYDGYGVIDINRAVNSNYELPPDPHKILGTIGSITITPNDNGTIDVIMDDVANAFKYKLFDRGVEIYSVEFNLDTIMYSLVHPGLTTFSRKYTYTPSKNYSNNPHIYTYKAFRFEQETELSDPLIYHNIMFKNIFFNN